MSINIGNASFIADIMAKSKRALGLQSDAEREVDRLRPAAFAARAAAQTAADEAAGSLARLAEIEGQRAALAGELDILRAQDVLGEAPADPKREAHLGRQLDRLDSTARVLRARAADAETTRWTSEVTRSGAQQALDAAVFALEASQHAVSEADPATFGLAPANIWERGDEYGPRYGDPQPIAGNDPEVA